ncbi:DUF2188 domain-containing protein [Proteiniclasticum sp. SCR006]|uniref:DUF2188 domain-containing protein n=1 Tax=Proteiniclasticum aestuarii TaxID=2817862 RepID=A0A939H8N4_9CLOT|nr:DUF2188 domain-containing protein [Proteiniclasticum aestuarii]MBO1266274.1 DUF2188 domain-containing protein [Proteiniclasticum aestuarii]
MAWSRKDYPESMKNLDEPVRNKAIEIANSLMEEDYEEGRALSIAISQAKEWYENRGEETVSHITHHLVSEGSKWILKTADGDEQRTFSTKEEAMKEIETLRKEKSMKVMVHDADGKFQKVI